MKEYNAREVVEHLLLITGSNPKIVDSLEIAKVINDEREITSKYVDDMDFLDNFKKPNFLIIIDKIVHVYMFGKRESKANFNVIELLGNQAFHYHISKMKFIDKVQKDLAEPERDYLPISFYRKIIGIKPDYSERELLDDEEINLFIRNDLLYPLWRLSGWKHNKLEDYGMENRNDFEERAEKIIEYIILNFK